MFQNKSVFFCILFQSKSAESVISFSSFLVSDLIKDAFLANSLEEVSLSRGGLGHLPSRGQGHVIGDLVRGLAVVLWRGSWGAQDRQGPRSYGPKLQGGRGRVGPDVVWSQGPRGASVSAGLGLGWVGGREVGGGGQIRDRINS